MVHLRPVLSFNRMLPILAHHETWMCIARLRCDADFERAHRQAYVNILAQNGWSEEGFEWEMLRRIDEGWETKTPAPRGNRPMREPATLRGGAHGALSVFGVAWMLHIAVFVPGGCIRCKRRRHIPCNIQHPDHS